MKKQIVLQEKRVLLTCSGDHFETSEALLIRDGRTWAIAVRGHSYKSLFLLNSGGFFSLENMGNSVLNFGSLKTLQIAMAQVLPSLIHSVEIRQNLPRRKPHHHKEISKPPVKTRSLVTGALGPPFGCLRAP